MLTMQVCEICNEEIRDPVCLRCYNKELLAWLRETIGNKEMIKYITSKINILFLRQNYGIEHCILCQKNSIFVCKHCYFLAFKRILQDLNIPNKTVRYFSVVFDYIPYDANHGKGGLKRRYIQI